MSRHLSMRTANPALQSDTFRKSMSGSIASDGTMTINGVVNKICGVNTGSGYNI